MESDSTYPGCTKPAITIPAKATRPGPSILKKPTGSKQGSQCEEAEQRQQRNVGAAAAAAAAAAASCTQLGRTAVLSTVGTVEGLDDSCPNPVIHDRRAPKVVNPIGLGNGFEESPGWRQYYGSSSESAKVEGLYLRDHASRWRSDQSVANTKAFSTETVITTETNTLSDWHSTGPAKGGSKRRLFLPRPNSGGYLLKAGNSRLKQLIRPKNRIYFRTQPVPEDESDIGGQVQKLEWTASNKHLSRKRSKSWMERTGREDGTRPGRLIRNKPSSASIVDLNLVEARHGLEEYHRATLSDSWDEIFQSIGGFRVDSAIGDDSVHGKGPGSASTDVGAIAPDLRFSTGTSTRYEIGGPPLNVPLRTPALPGPRTSSTIRTVKPSPPRRPRFEVVVAELPESPAPSGPSTPEFADHESSLTETDINQHQDEYSLRLSREETRSPSFTGLAPEVRPAREASPATIALEVIEAEMANEPSLSLSMLTDLTQPFSINCTPPQPVIAPSEPPVGPLPELPEEFDKAHAASRGLSHQPFPSSPVIPTVPPPTSRPCREPSAVSTGPDLAPQQTTPPKSLHRQRSSLSNHSPNSTASTGSSAQCIVAGGVSRRPKSPSPELTWLMDDKSSVVLCVDRNRSAGSHDLPSPAATDPGRASDMTDHPKSAAAEDAAAVAPGGVPSSRNERIRQLKLRDLAKEKAGRTRIRQQGSGSSERNHASVGSGGFFFGAAEQEKRGSAEQERRGSVAPRARLVVGRPSDNNYSSEMDAEGPRGVSRRDHIKRRRGHLPRPRQQQQQQPPSPNQAYQRRTVGQVLGPSQIMVLAETDPETQTFRASTTSTISLQRTDHGKAESMTTTTTTTAATANGRKVSKYKCSAEAFPQLDNIAVGKMTMTGLKPAKDDREQTPAQAAPTPSTQSSSFDDDNDNENVNDYDDNDNNDDDGDGDAIDTWRGRRCSPGIDPITALVREDSDIESAPSKRGFAALARREEKRYLLHEHHQHQHHQQLRGKKTAAAAAATAAATERENRQLKLAVRLLSLGLEKLTTFVELKEDDMNVLGEEEGRQRQHGSAETDTQTQTQTKPLLELAERFARSLGVE